eukprot:664014-Pelagomonas_calceolata.AAC.2
MNKAVQTVLGGTHFAPAYTCNCAKALAFSCALLKDTLPILKEMANGTVQPSGYKYTRCEGGGDIYYGAYKVT